MMGPVSSTGRAMMSSLKQAMAKGMPLDQALAYVKSMATQGVAPLSDLYIMMLQAQKLQQPQAQIPQTPPTVRDNLNMAAQQREQQDRMTQGIGGLNAGSMEEPGFYGGGIVSFDNGGTADSDFYNLGDSISGYFGDVIRGFSGAAPGGQPFQSQEMYALSADPTLTDEKVIAAYREAVAKGDPKANEYRKILINRNLGEVVERTNRELARNKPTSLSERTTKLGQDLGLKDKPPVTPPPAGTGQDRAGTGGAAPAASTFELPKIPEMPEQGLNPFLNMLEEAQKARGIGGASKQAGELLAQEEAEEKRLTPEQKRLAQAQAFFKMGEAYSRRGRQRVSGLGGLAEAGAAYTASLKDINKELRDAARARNREKIALARADEAQALGNIQTAAQMRQQARQEALQRTQSALQQLESRLDRDLRKRLGEATIAAQNMQTMATVKQRAMGDYAEAVQGLTLDPKYNDLTPEQQQKYLKDLYERMVTSVVSGLTGGGAADYTGFSLVEQS